MYTRNCLLHDGNKKLFIFRCGRSFCERTATDSVSNILGSCATHHDIRVCYLIAVRNKRIFYWNCCDGLGITNNSFRIF